MKQTNEERKPPKCVHCHREMLNGYGNKTVEFPFCSNPKCPNYGLLQTGVLPAEPKKRRLA